MFAVESENVSSELPVSCSRGSVPAPVPWRVQTPYTMRASGLCEECRTLRLSLSSVSLCVTAAASGSVPRGVQASSTLRASGLSGGVLHAASQSESESLCVTTACASVFVLSCSARGSTPYVLVLVPLPFHVCHLSLN